MSLDRISILSYENITEIKELPIALPFSSFNFIIIFNLFYIDKGSLKIIVIKLYSSLDVPLQSGRISIFLTFRLEGFQTLQIEIRFQQIIIKFQKFWKNSCYTILFIISKFTFFKLNWKDFISIFLRSAFVYIHTEPISDSWF